MDVIHNTNKTTMKAWIGYHSISLQQADIHLTTSFITPKGRFRYLRRPQGFLASGDGYSHRYDMITMGFKNIKKDIDDTLIWASNLV